MSFTVVYDVDQNFKKFRRRKNYLPKNDFTETKNKPCVTAFTAEDKLNLVKEYEILEKEIHQHFLASI